MSAKTDTTTLILDNAQRMVQTRGYHAFSYADISAEVGIRKASIHYYFPHKSDLGRELVARYRESVRSQRRWICLQTSVPEERLQLFAELYRDMLRSGHPEAQGRICLCASLATDLMGLPPAVREEIQSYYIESEAWLAEVLEAGRSSGLLRFDGPAPVQARALFAGFQGAMLLARAHGDAEQYCMVAHRLLAQLGLPIAE
ncbi:MAG: TetR/AcrR family transcriptional regulator [Cytophagales bacterium]|nr:TetR/AcrR family transcriptional regulator [Armatimonadota bacterium]